MRVRRSKKSIIVPQNSLNRLNNVEKSSHGVNLQPLNCTEERKRQILAHYLHSLWKDKAFRIDHSQIFTRFPSRLLTWLRVEVNRLFPGARLPEDICAAGLLLFDRFAILNGSTWPFIVCLRENEDWVFMSNPGGLGAMLLAGLAETEVEDMGKGLSWAEGDSFALHGKEGVRRRHRRLRRMLFRFLHFRGLHIHWKINRRFLHFIRMRRSFIRSRLIPKQFKKV